MLSVSMPNFATSSAFVDTATKCFATAASSPRAAGARPRDAVLGGGRRAGERRARPVTRRVRVGHRLERRERLRRDDEQRLVGGEIAGRLDEGGRVDVRDETEGHGGP